MTTNVPESALRVIFAVLDTNVLLPPRLSDILFDLFLEGLYFPRWTSAIEEEFTRNFGQKALTKSKADQKTNAESVQNSLHIELATRRLSCFRNAVGPEYQLFMYDKPEYLCKVPANVHRNDIHVVSAALALQALSLQTSNTNRTVIVSNNLKHLAIEEMNVLGISVVSPGKFIDQLNTTDAVRVENALLRSTTDLTSPALDKSIVLAILRKNGADETAAFYSEKWKNFQKTAIR